MVVVVKGGNSCKVPYVKVGRRVNSVKSTTANGRKQWVNVRSG